MNSTDGMREHAAQLLHDNMRKVCDNANSWVGTRDMCLEIVDAIAAFAMMEFTDTLTEFDPDAGVALMVEESNE